MSSLATVRSLGNISVLIFSGVLFSVLWLERDELLHSVVWCVTCLGCAFVISLVPCPRLTTRTSQKYDNGVAEESRWCIVADTKIIILLSGILIVFCWCEIILN